MSDYNRPDRHRLNRVNNRIEKALDELSRANGEMRPAKFRGIREVLGETMSLLEQLQRNLVHEIASTDGTLPLDGDENEPETNEIERPRRGRAAAE